MHRLSSTSSTSREPDVLQRVVFGLLRQATADTTSHGSSFEFNRIAKLRRYRALSLLSLSCYLASTLIDIFSRYYPARGK